MKDEIHELVTVREGNKEKFEIKGSEHSPSLIYSECLLNAIYICLFISYNIPEIFQHRHNSRVAHVIA